MESFRKDSLHVHGGQEKSKLGPGVHQIVVNLPADYGRRPLSDDEMDIINVSITPIYIFFMCLVGIKSTVDHVNTPPLQVCLLALIYYSWKGVVTLCCHFSQ